MIFLLELRPNSKWLKQFVVAIKADLLKIEIVSNATMKMQPEIASAKPSKHKLKNEYIIIWALVDLPKNL